MILGLIYCVARCATEVCAHSPSQQVRQVLRISRIAMTPCGEVDD